ncbi:unnamed protein product [Lactuca virosa]|uniref:Uncharacterized protein n=1 Tax=Lactuca virosa TaxID=75947 RepID=A0AAU9MI62_9ASTR|nr:unnamed protein product [Lactuca virosa]
MIHPKSIVVFSNKSHPSAPFSLEIYLVKSTLGLKAIVWWTGGVHLPGMGSKLEHAHISTSNKLIFLGIG